MQTVLVIIVVLIVFAGLYFLATYNKFVMLRNRVKEAGSDMEVQMKRRYDLIPNLVETIKGYAAHEKNTLEAVIKARNSAMQATGTIADKANAENVLSGTLKSLFALSESYPNLKANTNFLELQKELADTENKIQASRRFYNSNVFVLNTKLEIFPSNLIGNAFGFTKQDFFKLNENEQTAKDPVKVSF
ncbi:MAG: LemA family protein [Endomicrobium sp.]|jgi:LemA protein|uniref:LemA family protein n=1 Tax=Candidatus Endomicrobiellum pyrsonymphae TaxID=1408203 RepID=UPI0028485B81|nr:LemA family protein [Endomicrobium sp.]MCA6072218.1 LemA family protein [Endomicrobium sp.]MDR3092764.1 LemA family protein [Endomicrobium sp.]